MQQRSVLINLDKTVIVKQQMGVYNHKDCFHGTLSTVKKLE